MRVEELTSGSGRGLGKAEMTVLDREVVFVRVPRAAYGVLRLEAVRDSVSVSTRLATVLDSALTHAPDTLHPFPANFRCVHVVLLLPRAHVMRLMEFAVDSLPLGTVAGALVGQYLGTKMEPTPPAPLPTTPHMVQSVPRAVVRPTTHPISPVTTRKRVSSRSRVRKELPTGALLSAQELREWRVRLGLSQGILAKQVGCARSTLTEIERGVRRMPAMRLKIAAILLGEEKRIGEQRTDSVSHRASA